MLHLGLGLGLGLSNIATSQQFPPDVLLLQSGDALLLEAGGAVPLNSGIPAQSAAAAIDGEEWTVIVQGGATVKVSLDTLMDFING